jgi:hypothetical protein
MHYKRQSEICRGIVIEELEVAEPKCYPKTLVTCTRAIRVTPTLGCPRVSLSIGDVLSLARAMVSCSRRSGSIH